MTGGTKHRMRAFGEIEHHDLGNSVPFTIWLTDVSSIPLFLWILFIEVFHYNPNQLSKTKDSSAQGNLWHRVMSSTRQKNQTKVPTQHDNFDLSYVDHVPSNAKFSRFGAMLYVFEDNEAVVKMIIKGRSPTTRHVSRTHRVALDWLLNRINLDPRIRIGYIDTTQQMADIDKRTFHKWRMV